MRLDRFLLLPPLALLLFSSAIPAVPQEAATPEPPAKVEPPEPLEPIEEDPYTYEADPEARDDESEPADAAEPAEPAESFTVADARLVPDAPGHRWVRSVRRVRGEVGRMEWSRQGDRLAYDAPTDRGVRGLHVATLGRDDNGETVLDFERCVTCEHWDFRRNHVLAPTWHPSGEWIVALVQGPADRLDHDTRDLATPARGLHADLWAFSPDGRDVWQLTRIVEQGGTAIDPRFSFEGNRLAWAERVKSERKTGTRWGAWEIRVGEFEGSRGIPRLGKVRRLELPWSAWAVVHAFTEDDRGLWLTVGPFGDRPGTSIARLDLETGEADLLEPLGRNDSLASTVPRTDRRVIASDRDVSPSRTGLPGRNELWLVSASGIRRERLTFFNHHLAEEVLGASAPAEAFLGDSSWSPLGDRLLVQVLSPGAGGVEEALWMVTFEPDLRAGGMTP